MAWSEPEIRASHAVILELAVVLGEYRDNFAVVGGWVPPLLLREAAALHVGSGDELSNGMATSEAAQLRLKSLGLQYRAFP